MATPIATPNLAQLADPYYRSITRIWDGGFDFADRARNDYIENMRMPARTVQAGQEYLDNAYGLQLSGSTYADRMATDQQLARNAGIDAQLAGRTSQADLDMFDWSRPMQEEQWRTGTESTIADNERNTERARYEIERREAQSVTERMITSAPGASYVEKAVSAYNATLNDPSVPYMVRNNLQSIVMQSLQNQLAVLPPDTPEYARVKSLLIMYGGYGVESRPPTPVVPWSPHTGGMAPAPGGSVPAAPASSAPVPVAPSPEVAAPYGLRGPVTPMATGAGNILGYRGTYPRYNSQFQLTPPIEGGWTP